MERKLFKGSAVYPGQFYGKCLLIAPFKNTFQPQHTKNKKDIEKELKKFQRSLNKTKKDLKEIYKLQSDNFQESEALDIIQSQIAMLEDPTLINGVTLRIKSEKETAQTALFHTIQHISEIFINMEDDFFRDRLDHIRDIHKKLEDHLNNNSELKYFKEKLSQISDDVILVMAEMSPSFMLSLDRTRIKAIATDMGGKTGHMAILARNYGIPTIVGLKNLSANVSNMEFIFFDGNSGSVIINPNIHEIEFYDSLEIAPASEKKEAVIKTAITRDGVSVKVRGNLETAEDCEMALKQGVDGIGLFRSEILFMKNPHHIPGEEEQFQLYKNILSGMKNKRVVIRTFDIGADKLDHIFVEENPFLGNRGIRYTLQNRKLFEDQITAILRASVYGRAAILLPMVNSLAEIKKTKEVLEFCRMKLRKQNIPYRSNIKLGIMVETPAAALSLDVFTEECDFFSLGTNDLLQYTAAVDRNNIYVSDLYNPYHISFLRILSQSVMTADKHNIPISICGEIASDISNVLLLLGLGIKDFSVALPFVNEVKRIICAVDTNQAKKITRKVLQLSSGEQYEEIKSYLVEQKKNLLG